AWVILTLTTSEEEKTGPAQVKEGYCPDCGRPLPKSAQVSGECPYCAIEVSHGERPKRIRSSLATSPVIPIVLVCLFCVLLSIHLSLFVRARAGRTGEEVLYYYNCPKCNRKLRYRNHQIGRVSQCPICRRPLAFPRPDGSEAHEPLFRRLTGRLRRLFS